LGGWVGDWKGGTEEGREETEEVFVFVGCCCGGTERTKEFRTTLVYVCYNKVHVNVY